MHKIHESSEVTSPNRVTRKQVVAAVVLQQAIQMMLEYFWMDPTVENGGPISMHIPQREALAPTIHHSLEVLPGRRVAAFLSLHKAQDLVSYVNWWAIPLAQISSGCEYHWVSLCCSALY